MGQKMVRFAELCGTRSRQGAPKEVHEAGRIRPSSGCNGAHVRWWIGLICALFCIAYVYQSMQCACAVRRASEMRQE
jgi:hypothetical protein